MKAYEALCRGELEVPIQLSSRLKCRYLTENHPFLLIAPFRIEMIYHKPDIILFHDVLSDDEIETIKRLAIPKLRRSLVKDVNGSSIVSRVRTSKLGWLNGTETDTEIRIIRRISLMTGLSQEKVDRLQVLNYGIGGHYEPHHDFFTKRRNHSGEVEGMGNRIATVLFYMSDVAQGGATVFTKIGVKVKPVKGTAMFWYNLNATLERDYATRHAACPVLQGSKWALTRWIYQVGQEFNKPCSLEKDAPTSKIVEPVAKSVNQAKQHIP